MSTTFELYRFDNPNGTTKDWAIEKSPKSSTECITRWGASDNRDNNDYYLVGEKIVSTLAANSWFKRMDAKRKKGYYLVNDVEIEDDGKLVRNDGSSPPAEDKPEIFYWDYSPPTSIPVAKKSEMIKAFHEACHQIADNCSFVHNPIVENGLVSSISITKGSETEYMRFDSSFDGFNIDTDRGSGTIDVTKPFGILWLIFLMAIQMKFKESMFNLQDSISIVNGLKDEKVNHTDLEEIAKFLGINLTTYKEDLFNLEILIRPFKILRNKNDESKYGIPYF